MRASFLKNTYVDPRRVLGQSQLCMARFQGYAHFHIQMLQVNNYPELTLAPLITVHCSPLCHPRALGYYL